MSRISTTPRRLFPGSRSSRRPRQDRRPRHGDPEYRHENLPISLAANSTRRIAAVLENRVSRRAPRRRPTDTIGGRGHSVPRQRNRLAAALRATIMAESSSGRLLLLVLATLLFSACTPRAPTLPPLPNDETLAGILSRMTLDEKIGQLFMVGFDKETVDDDVQRLLQEFKLGSVILFERNIAGMRPWTSSSTDVLPDHDRVVRNVVALTNALQAAVPSLVNDRDITVPLLIAADQENGSTVRLEAGVTALPGALALGQTRDGRLAYEAGRVTGAELRALGINTNLAPVMDVNTNAYAQDIISDRAFGGHQNIVGPLGAAFVRGLRAGGVVAVAKHFPGHGDSVDNPHYTLPVVDVPYLRLMDVDVPPFRAAIDAGVPAIMTAHMSFSALSTREGLPFSMDPHLQVLLREELGFGGVVVSDDVVSMSAATGAGNRTLNDAIRLSQEAGTDLVVLAHTCLPGREMQGACLTGEVTVSQLRDIWNAAKARFAARAEEIDRSVLRILALKRRIYSEFRRRSSIVNVEKAVEVVRSPEHRAIAKEIAESAIVLLREDGKAVSELANTRYFSGANSPLGGVNAGHKILVVSPVFTRPELLGSGIRGGHHSNVETILLLSGWRTTPPRIWSRVWPSGEADPDVLVTMIAEAAQDAEALLFGVVERQHSKVLESVLAEASGNTPVFVILGRQPGVLPRSILYRPNVTTILAGSNSAPSIEAVVDVLYGATRPKTSDYVSVSVDPGNWIDIATHSLAEVVNRDWPNKEDGLREDRLGLVIEEYWAGFMFLVSYLAGILGALAAVMGRQPLPRGWLFDRKGEERQAGWVAILCTRAAFGVVTYTLAVWEAVPWHGATEVDTIGAAILWGFVGGTVGHALLSWVPFVGSVGGR